MKQSISFYFQGGEKQCINVAKFGATWTDDQNNFKKIFGKTSLKLLILLFIIVFLILII